MNTTLSVTPNGITLHIGRGFATEVEKQHFAEIARLAPTDGAAFLACALLACTRGDFETARSHMQSLEGNLNKKGTASK